MTALYAVVVGRNEEHRYLDTCLRWLNGIVDETHFYDDGSVDHTAAIADKAGCVVDRRPEHIPTFIEDESALRQAAWEAFETTIQPAEGSWVFACDADEFLVALRGYEERRTIQHNIDRAHDADATTITVPIPEVFGIADNGCPKLRTDGWWASTTGHRFMRYRPGATFDHRELGGGSLPVDDRPPVYAERMHLLHYGYLRPADRNAKYLRYVGRPGHSPAHVASILEPPTTTTWLGKHPEITA